MGSHPPSKGRFPAEGEFDSKWQLPGPHSGDMFSQEGGKFVGARYLISWISLFVH